MADRGEVLAALETRFGHQFRSRELLNDALTHRSWANEAGGVPHYERLEFLGDAVLGLVTADWLFELHAGRAEGELSLRKSMLVSEDALASYAGKIELGVGLRLGAGEERSGGRLKASLLADVLEALFGAVYLDAGFETARRVVRQFLESASELPLEQRAVDPKTTLQEHVQARGWPLPVYRVVEEGGPDHDKVFTVEVHIRGGLAGRGIGRTKKGAEQAAAGGALAMLDVLPGDSPPPVEPPEPPEPAERAEPAENASS
ncbi:MAG: ribonuclease III [Thermoanaerobaculia bacterium]